jgi:hypothetical protein
MPITFLWNMNKPRLERFLIGSLMALGLVASAAAVVKAAYIALHLNVGPNLLLNSLYLSIWAKLEELVGIIAACAPTLKSPTERALRRLGLISNRSSTVNDGPMRVCSAEFVGRLSDKELDEIAGDNLESAAERADIKRQLKNLEEGQEVLKA